MTRPKTTAEKQAQGTYRASRDRKTPQFGSSNGASSRPPAYVKKNRLAYAEWKAVAPFLESEGILKATDLSLLASYCLLYARWREAVADVEKNGQIITVTSTTRTGRTDRPMINPAAKAEVLFQAAMMKAAVKFGLSPLDRPRVEVSPFEAKESSECGDDDAAFEAQFDVKL